MYNTIVTGSQQERPDEIPTFDHLRMRSLAVGVSFAFVTVGAMAQTNRSADDLRAAFQHELAPPELSVRQQARVVCAEIAASLVAGLAKTLGLGTPGAQLGQSEADRSAADRS